MYFLFRHWLKVSVSLLVVMGISWIIGVITFHEALLFVSYIFTIVVAFQVRTINMHSCNSWIKIFLIQGAMMFIMFVVLSKQVFSISWGTIVIHIYTLLIYVGTTCFEEVSSPQCDYEVRIPQWPLFGIHKIHCKQFTSVYGSLIPTSHPYIENQTLTTSNTMRTNNGHRLFALPICVKSRLNFPLRLRCILG